MNNEQFCRDAIYRVLLLVINVKNVEPQRIADRNGP